MAKLTRSIALAPPGSTTRLVRLHRRRAMRCVPANRKIAQLRRMLAQAPKGRTQEVRKLLDKKRRASAPCLRELEHLERKYAKAIPTLRLNLLNRHERARIRCR